MAKFVMHNPLPVPSKKLTCRKWLVFIYTIKRNSSATGSSTRYTRIGCIGVRIRSEQHPFFRHICFGKCWACNFKIWINKSIQYNLHGWLNIFDLTRHYISRIAMVIPIVTINYINVIFIQKAGF
ncbi:hypothetical protein D3C73_1247170 [compost metagenome]